MPDRVVGKGAALVVGVRHDAGPLVQADVEGVAQAELPRHGGDLVGAESQGGLVEEDVARRLDRVVHVQRAVALVAVEHAPAVVDRPVAGVGPRRIDAVLQRGHGDHGLEGRAGRIGGAERLVEQRLAVVGGQGAVVRTGHALDELVGVEARRREQAEDVPVAHVHHHRGAAVVAEHLQPPVLDIGVEGELDRGAGRRRQVAAGVAAHHPALDVDLHLSRAGRAAQGKIESLLHPALADAEARIEQDGLGVGAGLGDVLGADLGDVADHVGEGRREGIDPHLAHVGGHARQFRGADVDPGELLPAHVLDHRHGRAARGVLDVLLQALEAGFAHRHQLGELAQGALDVDVLVLGQQEAEVRPVGRQHHAGAVEDQAARRRRQHHLELVVLGGHLVAAGLEELEVGQPPAQGDEAESEGPAEQDGAALEQPLTLVGVVQQYGPVDHFSTRLIDVIALDKPPGEREKGDGHAALEGRADQVGPGPRSAPAWRPGRRRRQPRRRCRTRSTARRNPLPRAAA